MIGNKNKQEHVMRSRVTTSSDTSDEHNSDDVLIEKSAQNRTNGSNGYGKSGSSTSTDSGHSGKVIGYDDPHAVGQWLLFLQMERYLQGFVDNGYDDFETIKQIGIPDLEAIGVTDLHHQAFLLDAVRVLREQGAVWVYLLNDETEAATDQCPDRTSAGGSSGIASGNSSSIPWTLSSSEAEHEYGATTTSSSGAENSPRARGSLPKMQRYRSELTPGSYPWSRYQSQPVDEDLIQKVVDISFSQHLGDNVADDKTCFRTNGKPSSKSNLGRRQNPRNRGEDRPQLTSVQLAILVREKLNKECINLGSHPFNTKVSEAFDAEILTPTMPKPMPMTALMSFDSSWSGIGVELR